MSSSTPKMNISNIGSTIEVLNIDSVKPNAQECHSLLNVKSVIPTYNLGIGRNGITGKTPYPYTDQLMITIEFLHKDTPPLRFDIQDVTNQAGWTHDLPGLIQAVADICGWITTASGGGGVLATEATLQGVLQAIINHQDFEIKLVRDKGNGDKVICEVAEYNETAGTYSYTYKDVGGGAYVPVGPLEYLDPSAVLNLVLAELQTLNLVDFSTETTLASLLAAFNAEDFSTETTLSSLLTAFNAEDFATQTTLNALLVAFNAEDFATETTLAAIQTTINNIKTDTGNISTDTSTLATPVTGLANGGPTRVTNAVGSPIAAGKRRISVFNAGNANGSINGGTIKPGESLTWVGDGVRDTLASMAYDGTGTELVIITVG